MSNPLVVLGSIAASSLAPRFVRYVSFSMFGAVPVIVENIRCGGNDLRLGFYEAESNSLGGDTMFVLCGETDHN